VQGQLPICEHPPGERERLFAARDYVTGDSFQIEQCHVCGLALTTPVPSGAAMERYYPAVYYAGTGGKRFPALVEVLQRCLYGRRVRRIERLNAGRKGRVLDVGCGPGLLLREFQKRGWEAHGIEMSEKAAAHARFNLGLSVEVGDLASAHFPDDHFDAVVLWHVLEHLPNPQLALAEVQRILKPDGVFLAGVPNFGSWEARLARGKWFHLDVPRHLNHFTVPTLKRMLASAGLEVKSASFLAPEYDSFSFVQSVLNRLGLRHNLLYQLLRQGRSRVLREESIFQILASLVLACPLGLASIPVTVLAAMAGQGTAVSLYAQKTGMQKH